MTSGDSSNMAAIREELRSALWLSCPGEPDGTTELHTVKQEEDATWGAEGLQPVALAEVKKLFCCPVCAKGFAQRHNLVKHQRIHSGERPYECNQCGKSFIQKQHLTKHQRLHTGERPYVCQACGRGFSLKHNLTTHLRIHTGEKPYPCAECGKNFSRRVNLHTHQRSHQKKRSQENKMATTKGSNPSRKMAKSMAAPEKLPSYHNIKEETSTGDDTDDWLTGHVTPKEEPGEEFPLNHQPMNYAALKAEPEGNDWDLADDDSAQGRPSAGYVVNVLQIGSDPPKPDVIHEVNPRPFICPECGKRFATKQTFVNHYRIHTGQRPYECPECGRSFVQKQHLTKHLRVHSGERPFVCGQCDRSFGMKHNLFTHLKTHSGEKPFSCSECGKKFSRRSTYLAHQRIHYKAPEESTQDTSSPPEEVHLKEVILTPKRLHVIKPAVPWTTLRGLKTYKCHVCAKVFKQKHPLITHLRIHSGERPFSCRECGKNFIQKQHLTKHLRLHSGERPFSCQHCGKHFNIKHNLMTHQRTHTGERPFSCLDCGKSFNRQGILNVHRRTHEGNLSPTHGCLGTPTEESPLAGDSLVKTAEPQKASPSAIDITGQPSVTRHKDSHAKETSHFSCPRCGQIFGQREDLVQHEHLHKGERLYGCNQCGKRFLQKKNLTKHYRLHMGYKPFTCTICTRSFSLKHNLITHQRTHTGEKPFLCPQCGRSFSRRETLNNHRRSHQVYQSKSVTGVPKAITGSQAHDQLPETGQQTRGRDDSRPEEPQPVSDHEAQPTNGDARLEEQPATTQNHIRIFICPMCGKSFNQKHTLINHLRIHSGERPYTCQLCRKSFIQKQHLTKHVRLHTGERPYVCHECGRSFSLKHNLTTHQRIHTGERPYPCHHCGKRFNRRSILLSHERTHQLFPPPPPGSGVST
ncbi:uncharacterized protein ACMZJ9_022205 isoform 1-T2 [Mantella aurantiaca]